MKKLFVILASAFVAASCGSNQTDLETQSVAAQQAKQATLDSIATVHKNQKTIDSLKAVVANKNAASNNNAAATSANDQTVAQPTTKKHGLSNTARGAIIGGGVGAVTGAIATKGSAAGTVVGGVVGAGLGAGTGAIIDHNKKKKQQQIN